MQLVCAFGALGEYAGTFSKPVAIETMNDCILVLDQDKSSLTVFRTTRIGANVHEALKLYYAGDYKAAVEPWKQVIAENANYEPVSYTHLVASRRKLHQWVPSRFLKATSRPD